MRHRGQSPTSTKPTIDVNDNDNEEEKAEFLDQDDQDKLVEKMAQEVAHQTQQFQKMFRMVAGFAVVVSLFYPWLCQDECARPNSQYWLVCWTHALYSALNHALVIVLVAKKEKVMPFLAAGTLVPLVVVWIFGFFSEDIEHFHIGLVIGNVVTLLGSFLLRWDAQSTRNALVELDASKYRHKAL